MSQSIVAVTVTKKESSPLPAGPIIGLPYHKIVDIRRVDEASDSPIKIKIDDGSRWGKVYTVSNTLENIEIAVEAAQTAGTTLQPLARFSSFTVTKKHGSSFLGIATIGEHLILEAFSRGADGMTLTVENGTIYPDVYEVTELIGALTIGVTVA